MTETVVEFHVDLFPADALRRAAEAYAAIAEVTVETRGAYRRAVLRPLAGRSPESLRDEFANFVLAASVLHGPERAA